MRGDPGMTSAAAVRWVRHAGAEGLAVRGGEGRWRGEVVRGGCEGRWRGVCWEGVCRGVCAYWGRGRTCSMSDGTPGVLLWRLLRPKEKERLTLPTPPPGRLTEAGSEGGGPGVGGTAAASGASGGLGLRERMPKECARTRRGRCATGAATSAAVVSGVASAASAKGVSMKEPPTAEPRRERDCRRGLRRCGSTPGRLAYSAAGVEAEAYSADS